MHTLKMQPMELTILMPCLNEVETLGTCIEKAQGFLSRAKVLGEVLVADNGSTDGSQALAESLGARVVRVSSRGYGAAIMGGINSASGRYIIMGDRARLSWPNTCLALPRRLKCCFRKKRGFAPLFF